MNTPVAHMIVIGTLGVLLAAALPAPFAAVSDHLSTRLLATGGIQDARRVPVGHPQRQEGSALRIHRVESTDTHVCATFEVENTATVAVARVRFVGMLSFRPGANRRVQIVESGWIDTAIAPGARTRLDAALIDVATARREAAGEHVQALCALREVVHENDVAWWSITPNPASTTAEDAMGYRWPSLPRALVGQTAAMAAAQVTLCLDEKGAEYSPGAQVAIRDEPGRAARCTREGQWIEVDRRTGEPFAADGRPSSSDDVAIELAVAGLPGTLSLRGTFGAVATMQLPGGQTWGFVPVRGPSGGVDVALHDLTANPHRLVGTKSVSLGRTATFADVTPALSLRLAER